MKRALVLFGLILAAVLGGWTARAETAPCLSQIGAEQKVIVGKAGEPWPKFDRALYVRCEDFDFYLQHPGKLVWPAW
jgi:hypothetical protein